MLHYHLLNDITLLSHRFGTADFVRGGGGNTSVKDETTLWVKPSGTTLSGLLPEKFVAMNRKKLGRLYHMTPPQEAAARETLIKDMMAQAVLPDSSGRASVEAPLHDTFSARFVVHTHPALVNGMTCARNGKSVCQRLFPQALWIDYTDPGYTLCIKVRQDIVEYKKKYGREPQLVLLENHGIFVAADTPGEIDALYGGVMSTLKAEYDAAGQSAILTMGPTPAEDLQRQLSGSLRAMAPLAELNHYAFSGAFDLADGPISPDHMVYAKSWFLTETPTEASVAAFVKKHGYAPRVIRTHGCVIGLGNTQKNAELAVELAIDGAMVKKLAGAFGGIRYMTDAARLFIENWEVESYRQKQMG